MNKKIPETKIKTKRKFTFNSIEIFMNKFICVLPLVSVLMPACKKGDSSPVSTPPAPTFPLPSGARDGVAFINNGKSAIITLYAPMHPSLLMMLPG